MNAIHILPKYSPKLYQLCSETVAKILKIITEEIMNFNTIVLSLLLQQLLLGTPGAHSKICILIVNTSRLDMCSLKFQTQL
jgi:hypothetical protein